MALIKGSKFDYYSFEPEQKKFMYEMIEHLLKAKAKHIGVPGLVQQFDSRMGAIRDMIDNDFYHEVDRTLLNEERRLYIASYKTYNP